MNRRSILKAFSGVLAAPKVVAAPLVNAVPLDAIYSAGKVPSDDSDPFPLGIRNPEASRVSRINYLLNELRNLDSTNKPIPSSSELYRCRVEIAALKSVSLTHKFAMEREAAARDERARNRFYLIQELKELGHSILGL